MPAAVVLAAGASQRMGHAKALVRWRDLALVTHVVASAYACGCRPLVVVEGAHRLPDDAIAPAVRVHHPDWAEGPISSLRAGLRAIRQLVGDVSVLVTTVDRPHVALATLRALIEASAAMPDALWQPTLGGRRGHPLVLPSEVVVDILAHDDPSLRVALARVPRRRAVEVQDPAVLDNIDTPEDLARLIATHAQPIGQ